MYRCDKCEQVFGKFKDQGICPYCGSEDYTDVVECTICGCIFESKNERYGACPKCNEFIIKRFEHFFDGLSERERKLLEEYLDSRRNADCGVL